jgi:[ribosomal protein S18]-alanine N-acetyltransferase
LTKALAEARGRGARATLLEVSISNAAGRALYDQTGFVEVGRRPRYYADGSDAMILRVDLPR